MKRQKERAFSLEPSDSPDGHWKLLIGSLRLGKPATTVTLTDSEVDELTRLLADAETTGRVIGRKP